MADGSNMAGMAGEMDSPGEPEAHVKAVIAHGVMMIAVFALLLPSGALLARHKWLFGRRQGGLSKAWFASHIFIQVLAAVVTLASLILALKMFGDSGEDKLWHPHRILGIVVVSMLLAQVLLGAVRPHIGTRMRKPWNLFHHNWGRIALAGGIANLFLGSILVHNIYEQPLWAYMGTVIGLVGAFLLAFLVMEPFKMRLQRNGRYSPATHEYVPAGSVISTKQQLPGNGYNDGAMPYAAGGPMQHYPAADMEVGVADRAVRK